MKNSARETRWFLGLFGVFLLISGFTIFFTDKAALHLFLNRLHHPIADTFFRYANHLAEGYFLTFAVFLVAVRKIRYGATLFLAFVVSSLITQALKRFVFDDAHRPIKFFKEIAELRLLDGIVLHSSFSFPSGHSTAAFSMFFVLSFVGRQKWLEVLLFLLALLTALSRVYTSQHFFEDIVAGSVIGTGSAFAITSLMERWKGGQHGVVHYLKFALKQITRS